MGAMKRLFIDIAWEIYEDPKDNRWKATRSYASYTWEQAQQQVYKIANMYGTEEIISKMGIVEPARYSKNHPTIHEWEKKWDIKQEKLRQQPSGPSEIFKETVRNIYGPINQLNREK